MCSNEKCQRREPAADDVRFVSERIGSLPFAAPCGWPSSISGKIGRLLCGKGPPGRTGSAAAGDRLGGVRPSSGAAMSERERAPVESDASEQPVLAAPEDGRTGNVV